MQSGSAPFYLQYIRFRVNSNAFVMLMIKCSHLPVATAVTPCYNLIKQQAVNAGPGEKGGKSGEENTGSG